MKFSPNFTYDELTNTSTNLPNVPTSVQTLNLKSVCLWILEPLRSILHVPIYVNSAFRSVSVNRAVGGVPNSKHLNGLAVDIDTRKMSLQQVKSIISYCISTPEIHEHIVHDTYIHIGL